MSACVRVGALSFLGLILICRGFAVLGDDAGRPGTQSIPRAKSESKREGSSEAAEAEKQSPATKKSASATKKAVRFPKLVRSDRYWRMNLSPAQYYVTRRKGTEQAFTGQFWNHHEDGVYTCIGCGTPLFDSQTKFDSGTGWPSYWRTVSRNHVRTKPDFSNGMLRTEVNCRVCDAHLGHVFDDGPRPTGLRYCINSASIDFVTREDLRDHIDKWRESFGLPPLETEEKPTSAHTEGAERPTEKTDGVGNGNEISTEKTPDATDPKSSKSSLPLG